jgi:hypothetical protein
MSQRALANRPTREALNQPKRQSSIASSSSQSSSAEYQAGPSRQAQPPSSREVPSIPTSQASAKGKAPLHTSSSGPTTMDPHYQSSHNSSMPPVIGLGEEITYTPTTHRISKAKKGKKVHVCTSPGCGKVYLVSPI